MKSYNEYVQEFTGLPHGKERQKGIKRAIDSALEQNAIKIAWTLYYKLIYECVFYDDDYEALLIFPEYTAFFEKYPEHHKEWVRDMMWVYKWLADDYQNYYQISREQIEAVLKNYSDYCDRFNYNKRTYYSEVCSVILDIGKDEIVNGLTLEESHRLMNECSRDGLSNCLACERDEEVKYSLFAEDNLSKALRLARPIFTGSMTCAEVPHVTYGRFAEYYIYKGNFKEAEQNADKAWRLINRDFGESAGMAGYEGICILVLAYTNPKKSLAVFKKTFPYCYNMKNGLDSWDYYYGVYHLMLQLEKSGQKFIRYNFPDKTADFYNTKGTYYITDLKTYAYNKVKFLSDKFDERNGNTTYNDKLSTIFTPE